MAANEGDLRSALERRFKGDRSGVCIAAAVIENGTLNETQLKEYEGKYILSRTLALRVFVSGPKVIIQGTGQAPQEVDAIRQGCFCHRAPWW
jgi:hypothetical protein